MRSSRCVCSRRSFLAGSAGLLALNCFAPGFADSAGGAFPMALFPDGDYEKIDSPSRRYHLSVGPQTVNDQPQLNRLWKESGVTDLWLTAALYGKMPDFDLLDRAAKKTRELGMTPHILSVPFGHPTPIDADPGAFAPSYSPMTRPDGRRGWGCSFHPPVEEIIAEENRTFYQQFGPCNHFLDDDFRLADSPGSVGGCVCPRCKEEFCREAGLSDQRWEELLDDLNSNSGSALHRQWVDYKCDRLTAVFRRCEEAAPQIDLGIMVMRMGSERAGIRLDAYREKLFRVGEEMFNDGAYDPTINKTRELFSVLMHRRFALPGRCFSETTICPDNSLSKENMASKLATSTFADVRNTMFMCNIPADYWPFFEPRMKKEARYHEILKNHPAKGPFKHYWGIAGRYFVGDTAYTLFLAAGVPFEVCSELSDDGWTFLGDNDARSLDRGEIASKGTKCFARVGSQTGRFDRLDETLEALFAFRRTILPRLRSEKIPYIEEEVPIVLGWYPDARAALLWNVEKNPVTVHLRRGDQVAATEIPPLETVLAQEGADGGWRFV
ncbi:MAG: hypothetical protein IJH68_12755 [Thermoguttaceae bacterium]|nr:hypothetical protein [Thermoguttaceae bacterium]